jgi:hypothetical protein
VTIIGTPVEAGGTFVFASPDCTGQGYLVGEPPRGLEAWGVPIWFFDGNSQTYRRFELSEPVVFEANSASFNPGCFNSPQWFPSQYEGRVLTFVGSAWVPPTLPLRFVVEG